ncbi:FadR family transcriptional regulator [Bordetella bronchiseptica]|nr:FadR family transcriptional regulator [Bordetella bronchiseptica]
MIAHYNPSIFSCMAEPMEKVRRVSVVDEVVEQISQKILSGEWPPDTMLPSLRSFAASADVSMMTVREAIRILQARGLLETRHGVGTFVLAPDRQHGTPWTLAVDDTEEYADLIEAREYIESAILDLAAQRVTREQLARLREITRAMRAARLDSGAFLAADEAFHLTLAEAAHNNTLQHMVQALRGPMRRIMANRNLQQLKESGNLDSAIKDHEDIVAALAQRDKRKGLKALRTIIKRGKDYLATLA